MKRKPLSMRSMTTLVSLREGNHRSADHPRPLVELDRGENDGFFAEYCPVWDHAPWIFLVE
jgi:hypothetical protein